MTILSDLEISKTLALAIGWDQQLFRERDGLLYIIQRQFGIALVEGKPMDTGRIFDYRDPVIAFAVAERYDCFPFKSGAGWVSDIADEEGNGVNSHWASTPQKAIAMAVISGSKR